MTISTDIATLVTQIALAQQNAKQWEAKAKGLKAQLTALHESGVVPTSFEVGEYKVALQAGRKTLKLDDEAKDALKQYEAAWVEAGHGEYTVGDSFWRLSAVKGGK